MHVTALLAPDISAIIWLCLFSLHKSWFHLCSSTSYHPPAHISAWISCSNHIWSNTSKIVTPDASFLIKTELFGKHREVHVATDPDVVTTPCSHQQNIFTNFSTALGRQRYVKAELRVVAVFCTGIVNDRFWDSSACNEMGLRGKNSTKAWNLQGKLHRFPLPRKFPFSLLSVKGATPWATEVVCKGF